MKSILLFVILLSFGLSSGQSQNVTDPDAIIQPIHKKYNNQIIFLDKTISPDQIKESDFLKTMVFQEDKDLDIRIFMDNSLVNYLHQIDPALSTDELLKKGNYQFSFSVDGKLIYTENLNTGAGLPEDKKKKTTFRIPLLSSKNEDSWGKYMWMRFYLGNGGIDALTEGNHVLKIEIKPYLKMPSLKVGNTIASGEIHLTVPHKNTSEQQMAIQKIKPNSGWKVSDEKFDQEKIRLLNTKIAENRFRDITSIVVIKNEKLLLEEYFSQSGRDSLQDTRSVGKSFASTLMGIAIKDGYFKNENLMLKEFYDLKKSENYSSSKDSVTIKSLLTMSSGFDGNDADEESPGNEENMYPTKNWVKFVLDLPTTENKPEKNWSYFTAGVVLTGDILDQKVPKGLENYAGKKLFQPLGITNYKWQFTPQQKPSLAGGLRMRTLDFAKFGQLYKNNGMWNGQNIIDKNWVKKSFTNYFTDNQDFEGYGYLFWRKVYKVGNQSFETYQSSGNGGNKIIIFKEIPLVIVITAKAYNKSYAHLQADKIVEEYLLPAVYHK
ncbi:class C beta-lactamase-related serine hydrolase [Chryseobacterium carnipullorum]|uniref:Beta-lactamase n=1 Tax=Chryseobacterium carnipullorum TaxID=1124835 RepID=A0A376DQQ5_CHRCU|nr:serine hydrolase [Chryseobacterium carnipullorum]AZA48784.1 class C beta-lactamase-related serine hydrolase [Chryseobacterium carnipullorum]AZA63696.1 class C beta-lactamase-related serine hydrolase [Chryseobacterium carnipullorum]STC93173.1 Beta-lactamase [Chryseobacterium carnipullorum]